MGNQKKASMMRAHIEVSKDIFLDILVSNNDNSLDYLRNADGKHTDIVSNSDLKALNYFNIRNWSGQSDMGSPPQFSFESLNSRGKLSWLKWTYALLNDFRYFSWQGFYDDIALLDRLNYLPILEKCSVENVLGYSPFSRHNISGHSFTTNQRWLRYIYFCGVIDSYGLLDCPTSTWIDVGPFYGGLQYVVNRFYGRQIKNILVDFEHQLCRSFAILSYHFPNHRHYLYRGENICIDIYSGLEQALSGVTGACFVYCPASHFNNLDSCSELKVDLFTNFFSLGEMSSIHFREYLESSLFYSSKNKFLVNRFESSPFFEPTYSNTTSILDYLEHIDENEIRKLGVCPIHHYNIPSRKLNGTYAPRPVSSNYFELIS